MKEFWNKPEGWEYILPILFGICLNVFIMLFFTGRLEDKQSSRQNFPWKM